MYFRPKWIPKFIRLAAKEKTVASTCAGVIFAIRMKGGMINKTMIKGKIVVLVNAMNATLLIPILSCQRRVKAKCAKPFIVIKVRTILTIVYVSHLVMNVLYKNTAMTTQLEPPIPKHAY